MKIDEILKILRETIDTAEFECEYELFGFIDHKRCTRHLCGEIGLDYSDHRSIINQPYYCGINFSGDQTVSILMYSIRLSNYFAGIWVGNGLVHEMDNIDELPVYIFDVNNAAYIQSIRPIGNIRFYINSLLDDFLKAYKCDDKFRKQAIFMKERIKLFSNKLINKGDYQINKTKSVNG